MLRGQSGVQGTLRKSQQRQVGESREKADSCKGGSAMIAVDDMMTGS